MEPSKSKLKVKIGVLKHTVIKKDALIGKLDIRLSDVEADKKTKPKQITNLQTHLGALTACYYDLNNKLIEELVDKFNSSVEQPFSTEGFSSVPVQPSQHDNPVDPPPPRTTRIVN